MCAALRRALEVIMKSEYNYSINGGIMSLTYAYPKSRFEPAMLVDLNAKAERERLSKSALKGIYKALHIIYGDKLADEWVGLPNSNIVFEGRTPLAYMLGGGMAAMHLVRQLLDARRGGL